MARLGRSELGRAWCWFAVSKRTTHALKHGNDLKPLSIDSTAWLVAQVGVTVKERRKSVTSFWTASKDLCVK